MRRPRKKIVQPLVDQTRAKRVVGYYLGDVYLKATSKRIQGMSGDFFKTESELRTAYHQTQQACGIIRVYSDGSEVVVEPNRNKGL